MGNVFPYMSLVFVLQSLIPGSYINSNRSLRAGIRSKLDYLQDLGVRSLWLSPIYKSPMKDFGYDVSNFREVDPLFGSMEDFDNLLTDVKAKGQLTWPGRSS